MAADGRSFRIASDVFLRLLGVIYVFAFVSFGSQILGLIGEDGIMPFARTVAWGQENLGTWERWHRLPTLCWLDASDGFLTAQWILGAIAGAALLAGVFPLGTSFVCWLLYLSLVTAGRKFMAYQWDNLLLEAGLLAIVLAPALSFVRWRRFPRPPRAAVVLLHLLLFRLIFSSGFAKFSSGDEAWSGLTALTVHYETQPLPTWIGWYWHQAPEWFHKLGGIGVVVGQVFLRFGLLGPKWPRRVAAIGTFGFQFLIALTGNYGFFNILTMALCLLALDDAVWSRWTRLEPVFDERPRSKVGFALRSAAAAFLIVASAVQFTNTLRLPGTPSMTARKLFEGIAPFRSVNTYGLFAVMTMQRPEIVIEGSRDGETWLPYELPYKPGDLARAPPFVAPHMPRLDWQLWFAALGNAKRNPWLTAFMRRLLEGSPQVLDLLETNPFGDEPPKYVRAMFWDYRFTDFDRRGDDGTWWRRERIGEYHPAIRR